MTERYIRVKSYMLNKQKGKIIRQYLFRFVAALIVAALGLSPVLAIASFGFALYQIVAMTRDPQIRHINRELGILDRDRVLAVFA